MAVAKKKKKIAILGGGMAGLSAAWHLTHPKNPKSKNIEVTVYQQGWLLGGKCASTKNEEKNLRIEEHGVHVFGGGYFNALHMMKECYDELAACRLRKTSHPLGTFEKAFHRQDFSGMWWVDDQLPQTEAEKAMLTSQFFYAAPQIPNGKTVANWKDNPTAFHWVKIFATGVVQRFAALLLQAAKDLGPDRLAKAHALIGKVTALSPTDVESETVKGMIKHLEAHVKQIKLLRAAVNANLADTEAAISVVTAPKALEKFQALKKMATRLRIVATFLEFAEIMTKAFVDDLLKKKAGFASLDTIDYVTWLKKKGASEQLIKSPIAIGHPNILFAYPDGDTSQLPNMAAGVYFYWMLRISAYMGSYIYRFAQGTGETVITPLYQVLKARGVKFELFHTVRDVRLDSAGKAIDALAFDVQAKPKSARRGYKPLKTHLDGDGNKIDYWPEKPDYEQLIGPEDWQEIAEETAVNMESYWWAGEPVDEKVLYKGADFDSVVVAMSKEALHDTCASIIDRKPEWAAMMKSIKTTPTQAIQVWFKDRLEDIGHPTITDAERQPVPGHPEIKLEGVISCANYNTPYSCHVDFTDLIEQEGWPKRGRPKGLVYFCGPMIDYEEPIPEDAGFPLRTKIRAESTAWRFLQASAFPLFSKATPMKTEGYGDHRGLNFDLLYAKDKSSEGYQRFVDNHYIRANVNPTDRYVLSVPGSAKDRIRHNDTGIANLTVAGDWTYTEINAGCVEGAVMSGKLASNRLTSWPKENDIIGYNSTPWAE